MHICNFNFVLALISYPQTVNLLFAVPYDEMVLCNVVFYANDKFVCSNGFCFLVCGT